MSEDSVRLPNGSEFLLRMAYTSREQSGVTVLVVVSCISLIAVVGLLLAISLSAFNTRSSLDQHLFVRTHVAAYFLCILACDLMQAIGSIMDSSWIRSMAVEVGDLCTAQGIFKQASDVGTAFWTFVIALHTFCLLVLEWKLRPFVLWTTLVGGWSGIAAIVISGPALLDTDKRGPFFAISGYWCWISPEYASERITLDYMIMFLSAFLSFVVYTLIFLRLRGNLYKDGSRFRFRRVSAEKAKNWRARPFDDQALAIARQMLLYPIAYTILILPIAVTRFSAWSGHDVPFEATVFSASVFLLSGTVNVVLFSTTRQILPPQSMSMPKIMKWSISRPTSVEDPPPTARGAPDPYYLSYIQDQAILDSDKAASSFLTDSSDDASLPYQRGVAPLQIRNKDIPARPSRPARPPTLPELSIPGLRHSFGGESMYDMYTGDDTYYAEADYNDVSLNSNEGDPASQESSDASRYSSPNRYRASPEAEMPAQESSEAGRYAPNRYQS